MDYHPKLGQPMTADVQQARRVLEPVYTREQLDAMPTHLLLSQAQAFEDARGTARTSGRWA